MGTGAAVALALAGFCHFLRVLLEKTLRGGTEYIINGAPALLFAAVGTVFYWLLNKRRAVDFLIATESELKKVSWSSRKEVIGSTLVVIVTIILMGLFLYCADYLIYLALRLLNVYKI